MGCLKFLPAKRALSPSSSSILEEDGYSGYSPGLRFFNVGSCFCGVDLPEQLVVLGQALRTTRRTSLDLSKESGVEF